MKKLFIIFLTFLCACSSGVLDFSQLIEKNGIAYKNDDDKPYNGQVVSKFPNGKNNFEGSFENGIKAKNWVYYFDNGQKKSEGAYKDGAKEGTWSYWNEKGIKVGDEIYKDSKLLSKPIETPPDSSITQTNSEDPVNSNVVVGNKKVKPKNQTSQIKQENNAVRFDQLKGGITKTLNGIIYTGPVVHYHSNGVKSLDGYYTNGKRTGAWTFYEKDGTVKNVKVY